MVFVLVPPDAPDNTSSPQHVVVDRSVVFGRPINLRTLQHKPIIACGVDRRQRFDTPVLDVLGVLDLGEATTETGWNGHVSRTLAEHANRTKAGRTPQTTHRRTEARCAA